MKNKKKYSKTRRIIDLFFLACVTLLFNSCVNSLIFQAPACSYQKSSNLVQIPISDGQSIAAYYLPGEEDDFVILYSHGNAEDIGQLRSFAQDYHLNGYGVLAYDYRGYGLSEGQPTEKNTYEDIEAAYHYLVDELKIVPDRIIVHGRSVGSGPSVWLAERYQVGGLILESPFVSAYRVITQWPIIPFDKYNNLSRIKHIDCPVLIIHGLADQIIPSWHGQTLYDTAIEPKMYFWVDDAGHNDLFYKAGRKYWEKIDEFGELIHSSQNERRHK